MNKERKYFEVENDEELLRHIATNDIYTDSNLGGIFKLELLGYDEDEDKYYFEIQNEDFKGLCPVVEFTFEQCIKEIFTYRRSNREERKENMSDKINGLWVALNEDKREHEVEHLINAIKQFRDVAGVKCIVKEDSLTEFITEERVKARIMKSVQDTLYTERREKDIT